MAAGDPNTEIPLLSPAELAVELNMPNWDEALVIVDLRDPQKREDDIFIRQGRSLDYRAVMQNPAALADSLQRRIVLVCATGTRSYLAGISAYRAGVPGISVLAGGVTNWRWAFA